MGTNETILNHEMKGIQNYGIIVLVVLFALHLLVLGTLSYLEMSELRNELFTASESLPPKTTGASQSFNLPEDIIAIRTDKLERVGFYEIKTDKDYIAYANPKNNYILTISENSAEREIRDITIALTALYFGEVIILVGWWFFVKSKVRELFEIK
ncbi:MAG: hypothetical protein HY228_00530 [Candidatus Yonathbacteria bacterium]|nr:hypothetical protein [Candidatus Yonathbacteria bacterium]